MLKNICCSLCLSINKSTINIYATGLQYVYENLANFKISDNECWMCYICHTRLQQCHQLQQLAIQTRGLIDDIFQNKIDIKFGTFGSLIQLSATKTMITDRTYNSSYMKQEMEVQMEWDNDNGLRQNAVMDNTNGYQVEVEGFPLEMESVDPLVDTTQASSNMAANVQNSNEVKVENRRAVDYDLPSWTSSQVTGDLGRGRSLEYAGIKVELDEMRDKGMHQDGKRYNSNDSEERDSFEAQSDYRNPLSCDICYKSFSYKSQLIHHIRIHTGEKPFSCDICSKKFRQNSDLNKHTRIHTGEKPFSCNVCFKNFKFKCDLLRHSKIHSDAKPFNCDVCSKKFKNMVYLNRHMRMHIGDQPHCCEICLKKFLFESDLKRHLRTHRSDPCNIASMAYMDNESLSNLIGVTDEEPICTICTKRFRNRDSYNRHMRMHNGDQPYSCHICVKKFLYESDLQRHIKTHRREKPFSCDVCLNKFTEKHNLERHMRIHASDKPFICHICAKKFTEKSSLDIHLVVHTGKKPFSCDVCFRKFRFKCTLKSHKLIHTGDRKFGCHICPKKFLRNYALKIHMKVHRGTTVPLV